MTEEDMNMSQMKVFNRGVSAGYFDIYVEDVSVMNVEVRDIYDLGVEHGKEKLKEKQVKGELTESYETQRKGYLVALKSWADDGEIVIKDDVSSVQRVHV